MRRLVSGIGMYLIMVTAVWGQGVKEEVKQFSIYNDTLLFNQEFKPQLDYNYQMSIKHHKRALDFNYLTHPSPIESSLTQLRKAFAIPGALIFVGLYSGHQENSHGWIGKHTIQEKVSSEFPGFQSHLDDYIQWGPIAMTYGLKASGLKGANNMWTSTKLLLKAEFLTGIICHTFKNLASNIRPNGRNSKSFPSGHTSQAFVAATFMHKEFGHISPWYSVAAYGMATTVGSMRMMNNMHWFSDVMVGAAVGIGMTNLVYIHHAKRQKRKEHNWVAVPTIGSEGLGMAMSVTF